LGIPIVYKISKISIADIISQNPPLVNSFRAVFPAFCEDFSAFCVIFPLFEKSLAKTFKPLREKSANQRYPKPIEPYGFEQRLDIFCF
jgi:hypothetical protein